MMKPTKLIPKIKDVKFVMASRIARFFDPAGYFFPLTPAEKGYLSPVQIDKLIQGFIPGSTEYTGWGDLQIDHHKPGYRVWASVSVDELSDVYCDVHMIDRYSDLWSIAIVEEGWTSIYHDVAHYLDHTYMDGWTNNILREVPAKTKYITRAARQYRHV